ncbi:hypothetical protein [Nitrosomonas sp. Nm84]|uniref:hypothetical protein n=1 Tax=Nitrosomonas sp. Nm84 TaxID=200124 RepID=UPI0011B1D7C3|nr:hypothetical protein [Nitrosomonas sp. Nm84]
MNPLAFTHQQVLKSYLRCRCGVKNRFKMLTYKHKLRFFARFGLATAASNTFFNSLLISKSKNHI